MGGQVMAKDMIRYDVLAQEAFRGVVRKVLTEVAHAGLPGEHHFYIIFDTRAPGVRISSRLKEQYPEEMTIVIQHQYWDLAVNDTGFEIGLSFGNVPEKLGVPFSAIKGFFDPAVEFAVQFPLVDETGRPADMPADGHVKAISSAAAKPAAAKPAPVAVPPAAAEPPAAAADSEGERGAAVVSLDAFRKKT